MPDRTRGSAWDGWKSQGRAKASWSAATSVKPFCDGMTLRCTVQHPHGASFRAISKASPKDNSKECGPLYTSPTSRLGPGSEGQVLHHLLQQGGAVPWRPRG